MQTSFCPSCNCIYAGACLTPRYVTFFPPTRLPKSKCLSLEPCLGGCNRLCQNSGVWREVKGAGGRIFGSTEETRVSDLRPVLSEVFSLRSGADILLQWSNFSLLTLGFHRRIHIFSLSLSLSLALSLSRSLSTPDPIHLCQVKHYFYSKLIRKKKNIFPSKRKEIICKAAST